MNEIKPQRSHVGGFVSMVFNPSYQNELGPGTVTFIEKDFFDGMFDLASPLACPDLPTAVSYEDSNDACGGSGHRGGVGAPSGASSTKEGRGPSFATPGGMGSSLWRWGKK